MSGNNNLESPGKFSRQLCPFVQIHPHESSVKHMDI